MQQIEKLDVNKGSALNQSPVYEQLGFKHNLRFGAKSKLRDACKRFLRFAFLLALTSALRTLKGSDKYFATNEYDKDFAVEK